MDLLHQGQRLRAALLWALPALLLISCSGRQQADGVITPVTPLPDDAPQVEYGASLEEWEDVTQAESEGSGSGQADTDPETETAAPDAASDTVAGEEPSAEPTGDEPMADASAVSEIGIPFTFEDVVYQEIMWDGLIPADYTADAIMAKYGAQLAAISDGSPEAAELYALMQEEFDNAPANEAVHKTLFGFPVSLHRWSIPVN